MYAICFSRNRAGAPSLTAACTQSPASRVRVVRMAAIFFFAVWGAPLFGADDDSTVIFPAGAEQAETKTAPKTSGFNAVTLVAALLLASAGGWFLWTKRRGTSGSRISSALAVEETRPLGNRQYLVVASYEGRKFLLGVCPGQINLLAPLEDESVEETPHV